MDDSEDRALASELRQGRRDAWRTLYDAYAERVWRSVARLLGSSSADVADVVQETFLAAARSAARYDPERGPLWFWLWGIARRQVAVHFRKQARQPRLRQMAEWAGNHGDQLFHLIDGRELPPDDLAETAELKLLIRATLLELPADYELLLTAKYLDGVAVEDLAVSEGSTPVAIRSKLARARAAFRQAFLKYSTAFPESVARGPDEPHA